MACRHLPVEAECGVNGACAFAHAGPRGHLAARSNPQFPGADHGYAKAVAVDAAGASRPLAIKGKGTPSN